MIAIGCVWFAISVQTAALENNPDFLVMALGAEKWRVREWAHKKLLSNMDVGLCKKLEEKRKQSADPEVRRRLERIIQEYKDNMKSGYFNSINLQGRRDYPFIDEGMPLDYRLGGHWKGWKRCDFIDYYRSLANLNPSPQDGGPHFMEYRRAARLFFIERTAYSVEESFRDSVNEMDFRCKMQQCMDEINKDIEMLIEGDKKFYKNRRRHNPFFKNTS